MNRPAWLAWLAAVLLTTLTALLFAPLLAGLGRISARVEQLSAGGLLVIVALLFCLCDAHRNLHPVPSLGRDGLKLALWGLVAVGATGLVPRWSLPLALLAFCLLIAAAIAFVFGPAGVQQFRPALGAFFVFGLLAGTLPTLDWPLRAIAGRQAASVLTMMHQPVQLALAQGRPPELLLGVGTHRFVVATECNGFGLLTSALLVATILGFQHRLPWLSKLGLLTLAGIVAIVGNFLRIVVIALATGRVPLPYMVIHETVGIAFYLAGLALVWFALPTEKPPCSSSTSTST